MDRGSPVAEEPWVTSLVPHAVIHSLYSTYWAELPWTLRRQRRTRQEKHSLSSNEEEAAKQYSEQSRKPKYSPFPWGEALSPAARRSQLPAAGAGLSPASLGHWLLAVD